jgi:fermentation-respiration switch protein FrsA (DUF1100 family)
MNLLRKIFSILTLRAPFWRRSWKHRSGRVLLFGGYLYVGVMLLLMALEDFLLYHPAGPEPWASPPEGVVVEDVWLEAQVSDKTIPLHAWWTTPDGWQAEEGAVLFCHGNAGNLSWRGSVLPTWLKEMDQAVLLFDYPGFGKSGGSCTEAGCYAAGRAARDWLLKKQNVPAERLLLYGGSLGGGIAIELAQERPYRALILVGAFTSIPDMAQNLYPWLPGRWLVHNRFENLAKIGNSRSPVFVAHGDSDHLIPLSQSQQLFAAAPAPKEYLLMPGWGHVDTPHPIFYPTLRKFLQEVEASDSSASN